MQPEKYRRQLAEHLTQELSKLEGVLAVWEGGSAATETADQYSDIDLCIMASSEPEVVFAALHQALGEEYPIAHIYHEPKTIWPDLTQKVYLLEGAPEHFLLDVAIFPESATGILEEFLQQERHGNPVVHFDRSNRIQVKGASAEEFAIRHRKKYEELVGVIPVYRALVAKELDRGNTVDALAFFHGGIVRPVVQLLGILHRPFRFDFGLRYLRRDLPAAEYNKIERMMYVSTANDLRDRLVEMDALIAETSAAVANRLDREE